MFVTIKNKFGPEVITKRQTGNNSDNSGRVGLTQVYNIGEEEEEVDLEL